MANRWKHYDPQWGEYEYNQPAAFPWNRAYREESPRYILGEDDYWYDPQAVASETALLSCAGDLMCEPRMTEAYRYGNAYFFHPLFQYVRDIFRSSDFAVANLETTLTDSSAYAGDYHCIAGKYHCNGPACYLDAVRYAGFDALVTANNHNCDSGIAGLWDTLRNIDAQGLMRTGSFLPTDRQRVLLVKVRGFKLAVLSYGNRYNGLDEINFTPKGIDTCLNWFSKERCMSDVAYAREHGAEFILCYQHWGKDYVLTPNEQQLRILSELKDCGVDYIVGSHTHCLQAHDVAVSETGKTIPMMWSMGNFVTNERKELCRHTGILQLTLRREKGRIRVEEHFVPCYVFDKFGTGRFCVVPTDTTQNGGHTHPRFPGINNFIRQRLGDSIPFLPDRSMTLADFAIGMNAFTQLPHRAVTRLCVQSADLCPGTLYFALRPLSKVDQRRLVATEIAAVVTETPIPNLPCIIVPDVAAAYRAAYAKIRPWGDTATVILVAGHREKTVTRELTVRALETAGRVFTVADREHITTAPWQDIHPSQDYCVLELREDYPLGTAEAAKLCRPDMLVITSMLADLPGLAAALPAGGTLWYNETDRELTEAIAGLQTEHMQLRGYGNRTLPCPGLPYDSLAVCTGAALEIGESLGLAPAQIETAVHDYRPTGFTKSILTRDGVSLILDMNCKTAEEAESVLRAAPNEGQRIVVASPEFAPVFTPWATKLLQIDTEHTLAEAEAALLQTLREGDTLVLCGQRNADLPYLLRRIFGLTDGFLYGGS